MFQEFLTVLRYELMIFTEYLKHHYATTSRPIQADPLHKEKQYEVPLGACLPKDIEKEI